MLVTLDIYLTVASLSSFNDSLNVSLSVFNTIAIAVGKNMRTFL